MSKLKGNAVRLLQLLKSARYRLISEETELKQRKDFRDMTGKRNPRPNRSVDIDENVETQY